MRRIGWCLALVLCLMLAGCGPRQGQDGPTATPEPSGTVSPSPVPSAQPDAGEQLLDCLDQAIEGERVTIYFWQHPGSGPSSVELAAAEHGQDIKALFSALEWEQVEVPSYYLSDEAANAPSNRPGAYSVSIYYGDPWAEVIQLGTGDPVVTLSDHGPESVYLRADGAEELCDKLADLTPSAYINLGRTRVPPQESQEATLKLYLETGLERLKGNGHITDYTIDTYAVIPPEEPESEPVEHPYIRYTVTFSVKPSKPELTYWQEQEGHTIREDGWVEETIDWEVIGYDERDGCYGIY